MKNAVDIDHTLPFGFSGMVDLLARRLSRKGQGRFAELTDQELMTLSNQATNIKIAALSGLQTLGELVSSHDPDKDVLNSNGVGWLIQHLTEEILEVLEVEHTTDRQLIFRGIDPDSGARLATQVAAA